MEERDFCRVCKNVKVYVAVSNKKDIFVLVANNQCTFVARPALGFWKCKLLRIKKRRNSGVSIKLEWT